MKQDLTIAKLAYYQGQLDTLQKLGFSNDYTRSVFLLQGLSPSIIQGLHKEAQLGLIGKGLTTAGKFLFNFLGKGGAKGLQAFGKLRPVAGAVPKGSYLQDYGAFQTMMKGLKPSIGERASTALMSAGKGLQTAPGATIWGGIKEIPRGFMFNRNARGIGGAIGKGLGGYTMGSALLSPGSSPQPQPMQRPPMYGGYY